MDMKQYFCFLMLALASPWASSAQMLPLQEGNYWLYREASRGTEFEMYVTTPYVIDGKVYYSLHGYVRSPLPVPRPRRILVRNAENGNVVFYNEDAQREELLTSFEVVDGGWAHAPLRECDQESQRAPKPVRYEGGVGFFENAVELRYRSFSCADGGTLSEVYRENLGMLRRVVNTLAGPMPFELVHARVGKAVYSGLATANLEVGAVPMEDEGEMEVTFRYLSTVRSERKLQFPTAQEFDFLLRNEAGEVVYQYSNGQEFGPEAHERVIWPGWTWRVRVPKVAPGKYALEGWITTAERPAFAASVEVRIP